MLRGNRTRFFKDNDYTRWFDGRTPQQVAMRAIERYQRVSAERPTWQWPHVCLRFAHRAAELVPSSQKHAVEVVEVCREFRMTSRRIKGIFELWALHDWLLDQVEIERADVE